VSEHAVVFHLIPGDRFDLDEVEAGLESAAVAVGADYDGNELAVDGSEATFFLYGEDADALFEAVAPIVRRSDLASGSYAVKRYGSVDDLAAREDRIELT
jgi:hypothetical protein